MKLGKEESKQQIEDKKPKQRRAHPGYPALPYMILLKLRLLPCLPPSQIV